MFAGESYLLPLTPGARRSLVTLRPSPRRQDEGAVFICLPLPPRHLPAALGGAFADTDCSYHLNISEKKNLPNAGSVSVLDMKFRNSSALLRNASWMLSFSCVRNPTPRRRRAAPCVRHRQSRGTPSVASGQGRRGDGQSGGVQRRFLSGKHPTRHFPFGLHNNQEFPHWRLLAIRVC